MQVWFMSYFRDAAFGCVVLKEHPLVFVSKYNKEHPHWQMIPISFRELTGDETQLIAGEEIELKNWEFETPCGY